MTEGYIFIITHKDSAGWVQYIGRSEDGGYIERETEWIERARPFMTRLDAWRVIRAISSGWWDRLWHWRIRKIPVDILEDKE